MSDNLGKWIVYLGLGLVLVGLIVWGVSKIGIPLGKLPGDLRYQSERIGFYFPIVTSVILSILLTIIVNVILWLKNR